MTCCMRGVGSGAGDWARAEASRERPRMAIVESLRSMELLTRLAGIRFPIVRHGLMKKGYKACFDLAQGQADEIFAGREGIPEGLKRRRKSGAQRKKTYLSGLS